MENQVSQLKSDREERPKVSVCMITYGHEKYVEASINGVLMQECDFDYELIISNDCSPDNTDVVVQKIIKNHPLSNKIKYTKHEKNLGMMPNFLFALDRCDGQYIALCEGDDFWTDALKLQKQINFLKENQDCSLCFHNASVYFENTKHSKLFVNKYHKTFYSGNDILENWLIPTASMVFVNVFKSYKLPDFFAKAMHGDLALQLFLYEHGNFGVINENMCTYRINESGATQTFFYSIPYRHAYISQLNEMKIYFKGRYNNYFNKYIIDQHRSLIKNYKGTNFLIQIKILFTMITSEPLAILKYSAEIYAAFKIIIHNCLIKISGKKV